MLSFLRWLWGCWHKWEPWTDYLIDGVPGQARACKTCGKRVLRYIYKPS